MKPTKFPTKRSRISTDDQPPFPRGFRGVQSSKTLSHYTPSQQNQDTACMKMKRVRFSGVTDDIYQEVPSAPVQRIANTKCADPKTSEFAFFKKLKETSGHTTDTHLQGKSQSKKLKSDDCFNETFTAVKDRHEDPSSSSRTLNVASDNSLSFVQRDCMSMNSDIQRPLTVLGDMHDLQAEGYGNPSRHGDQHKHTLLFSEKRRKLRSWVAETSLPEIDELCSKGYDFVSLLLSRLLPESDKDKSLNCFKSGHSQTEIDFKFNPDNSVKKLHRIPENNFVGTKFWPPTTSSPTYLLEMPSNKELPNSSNHISSSHDRYSDSILELGCKVGDRVAQISCADNDSSFGFCAEGDKSFASAFLNELEEVPYPDEYSQRRECQKLMLGWDFDRMEDENKSSITPEISCRSHDTYSENRIHELGCEGGEPFGFCPERHKSFASTYPIELDRVWYPDDYSYGREPQKFRLGWDFDRMPDEKKSSIAPEIFTRPHDIYFDNRVHELNCNVSERATPVPCANSDSPSGFSAERQKYFAFTLLNELNEVWYPDDCTQGREPQKFLLGWDFDRMADEGKSWTTTQELAICPVAFGDEEQLNLDLRSHKHDPLEPYLLAHQNCSSTSILCSPSVLKDASDHFLEVKGDAFDVLNGFSFPVHNTEDHLNRFIYSYGETTKGSTYFLSPSNNLCFMSKVLTKEPGFPVMTTLISPELDFNQGIACLAANASSRKNYSSTHALECPPSEGVYSPTRKEYGNFVNFPVESSEERITGHSQQGMFNIHDWSSYYFDASINKEKSFPLLLDNSYWNKPEIETYSDSDEKQYFVCS